VLLYKSLFVLALVIAGFMAGHGGGLGAGSVALMGAALLLLLDCYPHNSKEQNHRVHEAFGKVEWDTIFFFIGLFIIVAAVEQTGLLSLLAGQLMALTGGDMERTAYYILWGSAIPSAFINNIPFVATMIPLIQSMADAFGGPEAIKPLWWALSLGACLGGNGTLVGASANVMAAAYASRAGHTISFVKFMALAMPIMLVTIAISHVYVWLRYFN
jgi:Na+/H+ antiporter NhaD/arsenite permease-like protein